MTGMVEKNYAEQDCYLVQYDEDQWFRYDEAGQQFCIDEWLKKAKPLKCVYLVIRLIPDPLFPRGDKTIPYVFRSIPIDRETFDPFKVSVLLKCEIDTETWSTASEGERFRLKTEARARLAMSALVQPGAGYEIYVRGITGNHLNVEKGRF